MFVVVNLETSGGEHVHKGMVPRFNKAPDVITWGLRTFIAHQVESEPVIYREAFAVAMTVGDAGEF